MMHRIRLIGGLAGILLFFISACANSPSTGGSSSSTTANKGTAVAAFTSTPAVIPTSTPSKLTAIPTTTVPFCEGLVSFAEANQILSPIHAITGVDPGNAANISTCQFTDASKHVPFLLSFENFPSGTQMSTFANEAAAKNFNGATITTSQAVNGVGDQAWFAAGSFSQGSISAHADALYVADGNILLIFENMNINGAAPLSATSDSTIQTEFMQIANLILGRL